MKASILSCFALAVVLAALPAAAQETGDLKIRFEYGGTPIPPDLVDVNKDVAYCGKHKLVDETLLIHPENKGIKNVVVYVYTGRGGSKLNDVETSDDTHVMANQNCRFEPHIVIAQVGDTLKVTNPDAVGHNANISFFNNNAVNFTIPAGQEKLVELEKDEPAPIPVACNIHPWMKGYVVVLDHPFGAVSNADGELVIKGLPAGEELTFRVFHEAGSIDEVSINGEEESWRRARFDVKIEPGMNDLGTVVVPADALDAN